MDTPVREKSYYELLLEQMRREYPIPDFQPGSQFAIMEDMARTEFASYQAIATAAREVCKELRIPIHGYDIRTTWECYSKGHEELEAALAALEQETK